MRWHAHAAHREVGAIKVVRWEKVRGNLQLRVVCGARALDDHAWRTELSGGGARRRTLKDRELLAHLERAAAERDELRRRLDEAERELLLADARSRTGDPPQPVADFAAARSREETRRFAIKCLEVGAPWVSIGAAGPEPVVVVGRAKSLASRSQDARSWAARGARAAAAEEAPTSCRPRRRMRMPRERHGPGVWRGSRS
mgnify:CR=1 FL=1